MFSRLVALVLSVGFGVGLGGCRKDETRVETEEAEIQIQKDDEGARVQVRDKEGQSYEVAPEGEVALPESFPKDIPIFPESKAVMSTLESKEGTMVMFRSEEDSQVVAEYYRDKLVENGWAIEREMNMGSQRLFLARKESREANVIVGGQEGETQIAVRIREKN